MIVAFRRETPKPIALRHPICNRYRSSVPERPTSRPPSSTASTGGSRSSTAATGLPTGGVDGSVAAPDRPNEAASAAATTFALDPDGAWTGTGRVDGFDEFLDGLAPDHDYLVAVGASRLRVPTVLLGADRDVDSVPGTVLASAETPEAVDLDGLV
ncbi:molybdopterin synthase, partial [Halorubrum sp. CBA1125]|nr:molybdopterin synthase [Halorubrum sp. CBA1125]